MQSDIVHSHGWDSRCFPGIVQLRIIGFLSCLLLFLPPTEARPVRVATYNIENGTGEIGSLKYGAILDILARMDADVVCFQELQTTSFAAWSNLAATLDYPYAAISRDGGSLAGYLYNGYFSRFPIRSTHNVESPPGTKELSRFPFRAVIDVPDAQNPLVIWNMHHKSGAANIDKFRRAIEAYRIVQDIDSYLTANPGHVEYAMVGDMNDDIRDAQTIQFNSQPAGAPDAYVLGSDIVFPVLYSKFPTDRYMDAGLGLIHLPAYWESTTIPATRISGRHLDYAFLSPALVDSPLGAPVGELYYSAMDYGAGLPKWGDPLPFDTSMFASDHLPVFFDIQMADSSDVEPVDGFDAAGEAGGPFSPVSTFYTVLETNQFTCTWSVWSDVDWIAVVPDSFTLAPSESLEVEIFLNALAENLPPGTYTGSVTFWNETTDDFRIREVTVAVRDPLVVAPALGLTASGYVGGPFTPASKTYVLTNMSMQPLTFTAAASAPWLTVTPSGGTIQGGGSMEVAISFGAQANDLPIGTHFASVVFSNQATGLALSRPIVLTAIGTLCDAVDRCDLAWATGGDAPWLYQTNVTLDGIDAAQSGSISSSQQSWMETVVTGPAQVAFSWRASSQTNTHLLRFLDNGIARDQISGETEWVRRIQEIATGVHTLRWAFATTTTPPQGSNAAWVDQIIIDRFYVSPADDWVTSGWAGGPFSPSNRIYTLTNSGLAALAWTAASGTNWVAASPASGTLEPGGAVTVECALNANADALPNGAYSGSIVFSNQTSGFALQRTILLSAMGPLCDAVDRCDFIWTTGGSSDWFFQTNNTSDGIDAAQSGPITTNQQTWLETTVVGPVQLGFQWRISSSATHYLQFAIDGGTPTYSSGIQGWKGRTYAIGPGTHSLRWTFMNNTNATLGSNAGWLDQVVLDYLTATPVDAWTPQGAAGGPFSPPIQEYVLTNSGTTAIQWTGSPRTNWITCTPDGGRLEPGGFAVVECSLNANAAAKAPGTYPSTIVFSNQTTGNVLSRSATLTVQDYLVITPASLSIDGYVGGPYLPESRSFAISNGAPFAVGWSATITNNWFTLSSYSGTVGPGATTHVVASLNANANALPAGLKSTRINFTNTTTGIAHRHWLYLNLEEALAATIVGEAPSGPVGGPFLPATVLFALTNRSRVPQDWTTFTATSWLTLDAAGGTLGPYSGVQITAMVNSDAEALSAGVHPATVVFSNLTGRTALMQSPYLSIGSVFCGATETCGHTWSFGGTVPWAYQTNVTKDGVDAAASGVITNGQDTWMQLSVSGSGTLSYWWKMSAEISRSGFEVYDNGARIFNRSGTADWRQETLELGPGARTIRWRFYKTATSTSGTNGNAWVDIITWTPDRTAMGVPVEWYQRFNLAPVAGSTWDSLDPLPAASGDPHWFQYRAGLNPGDPNARFHILDIHHGTGQPAQIQWWGGTNGPSTPYVVQSTTNLEIGPWNVRGSTPRVEGVNSWTNPAPDESMRYYRILAGPDP